MKVFIPTAVSAISRAGELARGEALEKLANQKQDEIADRSRQGAEDMLAGGN